MITVRTCGEEAREERVVLHGARLLGQHGGRRVAGRDVAVLGAVQGGGGGAGRGRRRRAEHVPLARPG